MIEKLRLEIPILLPDVTDAADACVGRLVAALKDRPGVEQAHVVAADAASPATLCVHFDPQVVTLARIRELAHASGAEIADRYGHILWEVDGIGHARRARTVTESLRALSGVIEADASAAGMVRIEYDRDQLSRDDISAAGGVRGSRC